MHPESVVSLAILADEEPGWKPDRYEHELMGLAVAFRYRMIKLWEYNDRWSELERHPNPFALFVRGLPNSSQALSCLMRRTGVVSEELAMTRAELQEELMELPLEERLDIAQTLWDSAVPEPEIVLTDEQKALLEKRRAAFLAVHHNSRDPRRWKWRRTTATTRPRPPR